MKALQDAREYTVVQCSKSTHNRTAWKVYARKKRARSTEGTADHGEKRSQRADSGEFTKVVGLVQLIGQPDGESNPESVDKIDQDDGANSGSGEEELGESEASGSEYEDDEEDRDDDDDDDGGGDDDEDDDGDNVVAEKGKKGKSRATNDGEY